MKEVYSFIPPEIPMPYFKLLGESDHEIFNWIKEKGKEEFNENSKQYKAIFPKNNLDDWKNINFFFSIYLNQKLPKNIGVPSIEDLERIMLLYPQIFDSIYCNSKDLILTSNKSYLKKNLNILNDLTRKVSEKGYNFSIENPLVISGLEIIVDKNPDNEYGFLFNISESTIFKNNSKFGSENYKPFEPIEYYPPQEDTGSGLSSVGANGPGEIYASNNNLMDVQEDERIGLVYYNSYEKEFEEYLEKIERIRKEEFFKIKKDLNLISKLKDKKLK